MGPIALTTAEQGLWDQVYFPRGGVLDSDRLRASIEPAYELACSLLERDAIPPIRWRYFTDPELNVRGHGKSRLQVFERNGTGGDADSSIPISASTCATSYLARTSRRAPSLRSPRSSTNVRR